MILRSRNPGLVLFSDINLIRVGSTNWGSKGLLSHDSLFNALIQQRYNQRMNITAQVSPLSDLNIDINLDKTLINNILNYIRTLPVCGFDKVESLRNAGSFNVSYIAFQTLFKKFDPNVVSETFDLSKRTGLYFHKN